VTLVVEAIVLILGILLGGGVIVDILLTVLMPVLLTVLSASGDEKGKDPGDGLFDKLLDTLGISLDDIEDYFDGVGTKRSNDGNDEIDEFKRGAVAKDLLGGPLTMIGFILALVSFGMGVGSFAKVLSKSLRSPGTKVHPKMDTLGFVLSIISLALSFLSLVYFSNPEKSLLVAWFSFAFACFGYFLGATYKRFDNKTDKFTLTFNLVCVGVSGASLLVAEYC